jgi:pyruvate dehydrogenase E2 component (dihydrolipoamide acetyltransferase)
MASVLHLPDLGEGADEYPLGRWLVKEGDWVETNQQLAEIEVQPWSVVELPSPHAGRVGRLHWRTGEAVPVGAPLVTFDLTDDLAEVDPILGASRVLVPDPT